MHKMLTDHFYEYEMRCLCNRAECDAAPMDMRFMLRLEALRVEWDRSIVPVSARRCRHHNAHVGGALKSMHLKGRAVDIVFPSRQRQEDFVILAEKFGFGGIGIGRRLVHIDDRSTRARWTY